MVDSQALPITIIIGTGALFLSLIVMLILILRKRFLTKTVIANFISDGGHVVRKRYMRKNITTTLEYDNGLYEFDPKTVITTFRGNEVFYFVNNPRPLVFDNEKNHASPINSENFKAIVETELIAKLFKKETFSLDNMLLIIAIIGIGIAVFMMFKISNGGVTIADSPENIEIMRGIIKQALASGV